jgi:uncharacterized protein
MYKYKGMTMKTSVCWFEIYAIDLARAISFYQGVLGIVLGETQQLGEETSVFWPAEFTDDGEYVANSAIGGQLVCSKNRKPSPEGVTISFSVDHMEMAIQKVVELGGSVVSPVIDIGSGLLQYVLDSEGNKIGLYCNTTKA